MCGRDLQKFNLFAMILSFVPQQKAWFSLRKKFAQDFVLRVLGTVSDLRIRCFGQ